MMMVSRRDSPESHGDGVRDLFADGIDQDVLVKDVAAERGATIAHGRGHDKGVRDLLNFADGADQGTDQDIRDVTAKIGALHHGDEYLPRTAELWLTDSERSCWSFPNRDRDGSSGREDEDCPVTGRLSDVLDDYVVCPEVLGEGHYGCVRECVHRRTRRRFACKSVKKAKKLGLEHLKNEVRILSEINHKGIMKMVDCYEDADYVHIVSEKYAGGELFDVIVGNRNRKDCLSEQRTARIIKSLLEAVAYLHDNDVVHRDIKPENILFQSDDDETIKLVDFGLARRHAGDESRVSIPAGTSYYMSPEVLEGEYDKSCDLWSVGVVAYMLLSGVPPFDGENDRDVFHAIRRGDLSFPARQWDARSEGAKKFVGRLLRRDPRKRMTAREALRHPWIRSLGQRRLRRQSPTLPRRLKYLKIP